MYNTPNTLLSEGVTETLSNSADTNFSIIWSSMSILVWHFGRKLEETKILNRLYIIFLGGFVNNNFFNIGFWVVGLIVNFTEFGPVFLKQNQEKPAS